MSSSFPYVKIRRLCLWLSAGIAALILWEVIGQGTTARLLISRPTLLLEYANAHGEVIAKAAGYTAFEALLGIGIAIIFSLIFAFICIYTPKLGATVYPFLVGSQTIPFICLAPLVIVAFGSGVGGKVFLSFLMCFFPLVTSCVAGIQRAPKAHLELLTMMNAPRAFIIHNVYLIFGLPFVFAGLRVAAPFSVVGAIVAEFNGAEWGLGKDMFIAAKRLEPELMMLSLISSILLSATLYGLILISEASIGVWYHERKTQ